MADDRLYFRQLLSGRDFAASDQVAAQMVLLLSDWRSAAASVPGRGPGVRHLETTSPRSPPPMTTIAGVLVTHHHPDHVGGAMMGHRIEGLAELLGRVAVPVHAHRQEAVSVARVTGLDARDVVSHDSGDRVASGNGGRRALAHPWPHAREPVLPGRRHARRRRHLFARVAVGPTFRAATPRPCTTACNGWPLFPTAPSCTQDTGTRCRRPPPWLRSKRSTWSSSRRRETWLAIFGR